MLKLINTTGGSLTAGQTIPLNVKYLTNRKVIFNQSNNRAVVNKAGIYDIEGSFVITSIANGDITVQLYADGVAIAEAKSTQVTGSGGTYTFVISDKERILPTLDILEKATLYFVVSTAATLVNANVSITEVR